MTNKTKQIVDMIDIMQELAFRMIKSRTTTHDEAEKIGYISESQIDRSLQAIFTPQIKFLHNHKHSGR